MTRATQFPIIGWYFLPAELSRPEVFANIRNCGANVFMTCDSPPEAIKRQLELAAEFGLKALVCDRRLRPSEERDWERELPLAAREYARHDTVFGLYVRDEPSRPDFEKVGRAVELIRQMAPEKIAYVNAYGFGGRGADSFMEYIEDYARIVKPAFLSFDCYPISRIPPDAAWSEFYREDRGLEFPELGAYLRDCWWEAWETHRFVGWKYGLPLWGFAMATPHEHSIWYYSPVTEGTVRLQVFTGLAYAIHALQYFTLPTRVMGGWEDGILDATGAPSARYEIFRRVNQEVAVLGPIVKRLECTGVYHTGPLTSGCLRFATVRRGKDSSHLPVMGVDGDPVMLSFLHGPEAERYLFLVNRNPARAARVQLTLAPGWRAAEICKRKGVPDAEKVSPFLAALEPGDGRLFSLRSPA